MEGDVMHSELQLLLRTVASPNCFQTKLKRETDLDHLLLLMSKQCTSAVAPANPVNTQIPQTTVEKTCCSNKKSLEVQNLFNHHQNPQQQQQLLICSLLHKTFPNNSVCKQGTTDPDLDPKTGARIPQEVQEKLSTKSEMGRCVFVSVCTY
jgi:hypothetical protein